MKRLALLLVMAASPAVAQRLLPEDAIACKERTMVERSARLLGVGDEEALDRMLNQAIQAGECSIVKGGTKVRIEEAAGRFECIAPFGSPAPCLWTPKGQTKP